MEQHNNKQEPPLHTAFDYARFAIMEYKVDNIESYLNKLSANFDLLTRTIVEVQQEIKDNTRHADWCKTTKDELEKRIIVLEEAKTKAYTVVGILVFIGTPLINLGLKLYLGG